MDNFIRKLCFHIVHSSSCAGLFIPRAGENNPTLRKGKTMKNQHYRASTSQPIRRSLMKEYGLGSNLCWKRRQNVDELEREDSSNDEFDKEMFDEETKGQIYDKDEYGEVFDDCTDEEK